MGFMKKNISALIGVFFAFFTTSAYANSYGVNWQINFLDAATKIMEETTFFHEYILLPVIISFTVFVFGLMVWLVVRYRQSKNPVPSNVTHHTLLEVVWTIVPFLVLIVILNFSIDVLMLQDKEPKADVTIKAIAYQWYWGYEYPQIGIEEYTASMLCPHDPSFNGGFDPECVHKLEEKNIPHKLATDNPMVVPVGKNIRVLTTSMDVIHAWTIPAFGVKKDAVPGRMNSLWFNAHTEGTYYGQCSELCGIAHAFMPITVHVVSQKIYDVWAGIMKKGETEQANQVITHYLESKKHNI